MAITGTIISLIFIALVAFLLVKKFNAQAVLLFCGLLMMSIAMILGFALPDLK